MGEEEDIIKAALGVILAWGIGKIARRVNRFWAGLFE